MNKQFEAMFIDENYELKSYGGLAKNIVEFTKNLPEEISPESVFNIKDLSWDDII